MKDFNILEFKNEMKVRIAKEGLDVTSRIISNEPGFKIKNSGVGSNEWVIELEYEKLIYNLSFTNFIHVTAKDYSLWKFNKKFGGNDKTQLSKVLEGIKSLHELPEIKKLVAKKVSNIMGFDDFGFVENKNT